MFFPTLGLELVIAGFVMAVSGMFAARAGAPEGRRLIVGGLAVGAAGLLVVAAP